jgi:hypothetical protein
MIQFDDGVGGGGVEKTIFVEIRSLEVKNNTFTILFIMFNGSYE